MFLSSKLDHPFNEVWEEKEERESPDEMNRVKQDWREQLTLRTKELMQKVSLR
jgi:hypothetical protein